MRVRLRKASAGTWHERDAGEDTAPAILDLGAVACCNERVTRRQLLASAAAASLPPLSSSAQSRSTSTSAPTTAPTTSPASSPSVPDDVVWNDVRDWGLEGRGFNDTASYFDRLPARARDVVRSEVWALSHDTSGMSARFEADTTDVYVRYELRKALLAMPHMPATGVSGVDLYTCGPSGWRWLAVTRPVARHITSPLGFNLAAGRRAYHLNLPLYNGVKSLEIGLPRGVTLKPLRPRNEKPVLFYGTSITQGGCASRPGMSFVNILGRRLDRPVLNFGFSGNGKTELEVARFLAEIDPAVFVIDTIANTSVEQVDARMVPLVKLLRGRHARTPILLIEQRMWDNGMLIPNLAQAHREKNDALRRAFDALRDAGVEQLHYREGSDLMGSDGDATVDGSHPSDLGMMRYADALEPALRKLLAE